MKKKGIFVVCFVFVVLLAGCASRPAKTNPAPSAAVTFERPPIEQILVNDRRFDGEWDSGKYRLAFYADTYILYNNAGKVLFDGIFVYSDDILVLNGLGGSIKVSYSFGGNILTIDGGSEHGSLSGLFFKQFKLLDERIQHPVVGVWKDEETREDGVVFIDIFIFYPNGTGKNYQGTKGGALIVYGQFEYNNQSIYKVHGEQVVWPNGEQQIEAFTDDNVVSYSINEDGNLVIDGKWTYTRQ